MKTFIIRHWSYWEDFNLTESWIRSSEIKWLEIRDLIWDISDKQIQIVSSTAPRALQTTESIVKWLQINTEVNELKELWDDDRHIWNLDYCLEFIKLLPHHQVLIIITHFNLLFPVAKELGYEWEYKKLETLWSYFIDKSNKKDKKLEVTDEILEDSTEIEVKIPVWDLRVTKIIKTIASLQKDRWWPIKTKTLNWEDIVFFVPDIKPSGDPEASMRWEYDEKWFFPVIIKTDWERMLRRICDKKLEEWELSQEQINAYKNQMEWLKLLFQSVDSEINPDNWEITKIK